MNPGKPDSLISPEWLRYLERLSFLSRKRSRSSQRGERRSRARGHSVEFADHRNYVVGDDLRYLDWNLLGRLDRLFLKIYEEERELPLHLFVDLSESMNFGTPSKFDVARQIAAAMGYVALNGFDRVHLNLFPNSAAQGAQGLPPRHLRGKGSSMRLLDHLSALRPGGQGSLNQALQEAARGNRRQGTVMVISDFMDPDGYESGLKAWCSQGMDVHAFMVLASEELNPTLHGDLRLVDCENGSHEEVTFGRHQLKAYQATLQGYLDQIQNFCRRHAIGFHLVPSHINLESWLLADLRKAMLWV
ncbi:MAG: DUF58 domain-containing protein [Limisphaerales bacterium]